LSTGEHRGNTTSKASNTPICMVFLALLLKMGLTGLWRREHYFTDAVEASTMSQAVFQNLLYTIRDAGFAAY
jgi:hypothetical protein